MPRRKAEEALYERLEAVSEQMTPQPPKAPKANPYHYFSDKIRPKLVEQDTPNDQIFAKIADIWCNDLIKRKYEKKFFNAWTNYYLQTAKWIEEHPEEASRIMEEERRGGYDAPDKKKRKKKLEEEENVLPFRNNDPNARHMMGNNVVNQQNIYGHIPLELHMQPR
eukprot:TRINITY_DN2483_c0_g2_i2.p1 TRINITY_DN2483_c0_g2~~TRINITY_DN2483_c0_g2_i2.p1  ORF type:complete len:166 (-),score=51.79 TRINITY_DN2483_c0_g2_i2:419-916(-)